MHHKLFQLNHFGAVFDTENDRQGPENTYGSNAPDENIRVRLRGEQEAPDLMLFGEVLKNRNQVLSQGERRWNKRSIFKREHWQANRSPAA